MKHWLVMVGLIGALAGHHASARQTYIVFGVGGTSCGEWVASSRDRQMRTLYFTWIHGFLTGVDAIPGGPTLRDIDNAGMELWLDQYCTKSPLSNINVAATELAVALKQ